MADFYLAFEPTLDPTTRAWFAAARTAPPSRWATLLPQLPRRIGRGPLAIGARRPLGDRDVDWSGWRRCDAAALAMFSSATGDPGQPTETRPGPDPVLDLFAHGDFEERAMILRSRAALPIDETTGVLLGEVQRTNTQDHFEAIVLDSDLVAQAVDAGVFAPDDFRRLIVKLAFVDLPLARVFGAERHADPELSRMLQDLATEREAAGRKVWHDTNRMIGRAPTAGSLARLLGGLEHGVDAHRLAAVDGLGAWLARDLSACAIVPNLCDPRPFLSERLDREPHPQIREAIEHLLAP